MQIEQAVFTRFWFSHVDEPTEDQLVTVAARLQKLSNIYTPGTIASTFPASCDTLVLAGRAGARRATYRRYIRARGDANRFNAEPFDEPPLTVKEWLTLNLKGMDASGIHYGRTYLSFVPYNKHVERFMPDAEATSILSDLSGSALPNGRYVLHPRGVGMAMNSWKLQSSMRPDYD